MGGWDSGQRPNVEVTDSRSLTLILRPEASTGLFMSRGSLPHLSLPDLELKSLFWVTETGGLGVSPRTTSLVVYFGDGGWGSSWLVGVAD